MMENTSPEKAETVDELHHAMDRAKNAPSSENIHHLIKVRSSFFIYILYNYHLNFFNTFGFNCRMS